MKSDFVPFLRRIMPGPLVLQATIAVGVLTLALSPARGGAALYLPLSAATTASTVAWSRARNAEILAAGPYQGALYIRVHDAGTTIGALRKGALLVSVPESLCSGPRPTQATETP
ncbi:hypothetical protein I5E68_11965 [Novosphingobium sp. YJ-S2-02]|uniref:Uncharacterized protein n=1 Tax=Novosphingobium aureum TaxID=2792964 RepID=A0A931MLR6_9SPHN|nr:hypothetical protein [Novosphingobium aureum]